MERIHKNIPQAKEMVFVDSKTNTDNYHTYITFLLTASSLSTMPLGLLPTASQTEERYAKGFILI